MKLAGGLLLLLSTAALAQDPGSQKIPPVRYPDLPRHGGTLSAFIPREWALQAEGLGDLNGDTLADAALVLHMTSPRNRIFPSFDPKHRYDTNPMMLVIVFGSKGGGYDLVTANHRLIPRRTNPNQDPPFSGLTMSNGVLRVKLVEHLEAGGWRIADSSYAFRWQDGAMRLIGFDRNSIIKGPGETEVISANYPARRMIVKRGTMEGDEPDKTKTVVLGKKPLLTLDQVGDGLMFEPGEH